jgi:hypothetical protein
MKKYQMAWVGVPDKASGVSLGSSDTNLIKWFLDELEKDYPNHQVEHAKQFYDFNGNLTYSGVIKLDGEDHEINHWLVQKLQHTGWEPFSVTETGGIILPGYVYMRREIID